MAPHTIPGVAANQKVQGIPTSDLVTSEDRVHALLGSHRKENHFEVCYCDPCLFFEYMCIIGLQRLVFYEIPCQVLAGSSISCIHHRPSNTARH